MKNKKIGLLISGGLDSTYLLWKYAKKGYDLELIYVDIRNNSDKSKVEQFLIKKTINKINNEYNCNYKLNIGTTINLHIFYNNNLIFKQLPIWILSSIYNFYDVDEIHIGYVIGDDIISYINDVKKIYYSYSSIMWGKLPKLKFPLLKKSKREIINELPNEYMENVISCESPIIKYENDNILDYESCGICDVCRKNIAFEYYKYWGNYSEDSINMFMNQISNRLSGEPTIDTQLKLDFSYE